MKRKWNSISKSKINLLDDIDEPKKSAPPPVDNDGFISQGETIEAVDGMPSEGLEAANTDVDDDTVLDDWDVARALHIQRRILHYVRHEATISASKRNKVIKPRALKCCNGAHAIRGVDWNVVNGEVGMTARWAKANGLDVSKMRKVGDSDVVSVTMLARTSSPQVVTCEREDNGLIIPVRINNCEFVKGMLVEVRRSVSLFVLAYRIPRKFY